MLHFKIVFEYFYFVFFFPFNGKLEITRYKKTEYLFLHLYHQRVPISVPSICFETIQPCHSGTFHRKKYETNPKNGFELIRFGLPIKF